MRYLLLFATLAAMAAPPQVVPQAVPQPGATLVVSNERVTVRDVMLKAGTPGPIEQHPEDSVTVFLQGSMLKIRQPDGTSRAVTRKTNEVVFAPKGGATGLEAVAQPVRVVTIDLHDKVVAP